MNKTESPSTINEVSAYVSAKSSESHNKNTPMINVLFLKKQPENWFKKT